VLEELEVLKIVSERLEATQLPFILTGSFVRSAVASERQFNLMHLATSIKVDLIVRKGSEYRQVEFARRRPDDSMDRAYVEHWAARLGVAEALAEIAP